MEKEKVFISYGNLITDYIYSEESNGNLTLLKQDGVVANGMIYII